LDFLSLEFWSALMAIVFIDLILAGDNAIVIALAARNLPKEQQKKAVIWGTVGAIAVRAAATLVVVKLLGVPGLLFIGGLLLIWIAYKLLVQEEPHENITPGKSLLNAIKTIIIADAAMGIDNVLAVAGASGGHEILVILGLLISIPIVVWGSTLFIKWINKYPWIIYIGSGVLAWTAAKMITGEHFYIEAFMKEYPFIKNAIIILIIVGVLVAGKLKNQQMDKRKNIQAQQ
jgi:YjbE family integral membrane protein